MSEIFFKALHDDILGRAFSLQCLSVSMTVPGFQGYIGCRNMERKPRFRSKFFPGGVQTFYIYIFFLLQRYIHGTFEGIYACIGAYNVS